MTEQAVARDLRARQDSPPPPMDRLAASLVGIMRDGFSKEIEDKHDAWAWRMLARDIDAQLAQRWQVLATTEAAHGDIAAVVIGWNTELLRRFTKAIGEVAPSGAAKKKFDETVGTLCDSSAAWANLFGTTRAGYWQHIALLWLALWHGAAAGMKASKARALVIETRGGLLGDGALALLTKGLTEVRSAITKSRRATVGVRAEHALARTVKDMDAAVVSAKSLATQSVTTAKSASLPDISKLGSLIGAGKEPPAQAAPKASPRYPTSLRQSLPLDGRRMTSSVFGTWVGLVLFSWVALIWGALISVPFGVGIGMFLSMGAGIIMVPLWGTLFGFLGMNVARDSTLRGMGFAEVTDGHSLKEVTARYARALGLPMPRIGVIDAHNAFAMGMDHHSATVAIGRPLLKTLTPEEVAAVVGHELGHVVSGDMRRMMLMRTFQNATVWFAMFQGLKQFARWVICWAAELYILAFSRRREYWADAVGAALAGKDAMIGALRKLESAPALSGTERAQARFMFRGGALSTHPSTAQRIAALEADTYIKRLPLKRDGR